MKNFKLLAYIYCLLFIMITSGVGWMLGGKIEKDSQTRYQADLPLQLSSEQPDKGAIERFRFDLLYKNNTIEHLAKLHDLSQEVLAGNLKVNTDKDNTHFTLSFLNSDQKVAQKIVTEAKNTLQKNGAQVKEVGKIKVSAVPKKILRSSRIGIITGFLLGIGILSLIYREKFTHHKK